MYHKILLNTASQDADDNIKIKVEIGHENATTNTKKCATEKKDWKSASKAANPVKNQSTTLKLIANAQM